ncbi:MAG: Flp pilus assembly protein CpaB, partial [Acidobacteria bacterium]|nr:Flp pilus assembly protein CpaB [Acidobacteriota bacterium]
MKKNVVPLVVIALVVAVLSTGIFYGLIVSRMDGSSSSAASLRFVSAHGLEKGRVLKAGDFQLVASADPGEPVPARAEDLIGRRMADKVEAGKVLTESLLSPLSERGLTSGIPEGMRAVTLHISDSSSVLQLVVPGDRVDIQALINRQKNGETDVELKTLLQNATVYNVAGDANPQMQGRMVLTVLSSPQDAERLSVA